MAIAQLHQFFIKPTTKLSHPRAIFWLSLSLTFAAIYAILALQKAFSSEYVVQDDARQHVFWMLRFLDSELFPHDLIADYFQSVAPAGYTLLYRFAAELGINPLWLNKILPLILGLIATSYCFALCLQMLPIPMTGFIASLLFNQTIWYKDDLISGTPRAFIYPLLFAFLYYLARNSLLPCLVAIALLDLFYPQGVFLAAGLLFLRLLKSGWRRNWRENKIYWWGLVVAFLVMLPYALASSDFAPVVTVAQAKQMPEFLDDGRSEFFHDNAWDFYISGGRSGMFPRSLFTPVTLLVGLFLPVLVKFSAKFPLVKQLKSPILLLPQLLLASVGMFILAHIFLFKLHLPGRYTGYTFRIIIALATGITLTIILDRILLWAQTKAKNSQLRIAIASIFTCFLGISLIFYPNTSNDFPITKYKIGEFPGLYTYLQQQPKDILIASLANEADNIPSFAQRSILVNREYAIPYHLGYYNQYRQRVIDLIKAHYSTNWDEIAAFIEKYNIDFWVIDDSAFTAEFLRDRNWIKQYKPITQQTINRLQKGETPLLAKLQSDCAVFTEDKLTVIDSKCILKYRQN
ncbi:MAG: hypothetical protein SAL07_04020 [Oscillatoria sp. PMC 1051.18]|nr:hypothetical protein [Oscillatoria sp. PMC 1050.18]MEC5029057.1 hypothetical protein [Oscillatoria sp. PMC 1051.18]